MESTNQQSYHELYKEDHDRNNRGSANNYKPYRHHEQQRDDRRNQSNPYRNRGNQHHNQQPQPQQQQQQQQNQIKGYIGSHYNDRFDKQQYGHVNKPIYEHYNNRSQTTRNQRFQSKIINMRSINNWIKSILIQKHSRSGDRVLDICGGKLGDLQKWIKQKIARLYVSDIALDSLRHGMGRLNDELRRSQITFDTSFICCDCFSTKLLESIPPEANKVDLVSCQFALHYSFRSEESARQLLLNVTTLLENGGYFIGTIPDACYIVKKCKEEGTIGFGNSIFSIKFNTDESQLNNSSKKEDVFKSIQLKKFGCAYKFFLEDAIDGLEEYLVHMDVLIELAAEYQLELVMDEDFHRFVKREIYATPENTELFQRMNKSQSISQEEWDALSIYRLFAFRKRGENPNQSSTVPQPKHLETYKESDIIINL